MGQSPLACPACGALKGYIPFIAIARARVPHGTAHGVSLVKIAVIIETGPLFAPISVIRSPLTPINTGLGPCLHPCSSKIGPLFAPILLHITRKIALDDK
ncbi:hypothetical protein RHMOL_Rhmol04G0212700 [Rhododendron molle]|uniref:Uncharacterized protein n=1 Tax=Rhododendron molle TaxID=49168 RepID=A0ACC0P2S6_RHOML|nr:hypothetical protein RHMOL_Rhmol04G0212700 [Rhododendron molle]